MSNNKMEYKRDTYWDTVKALLIFLVIAGHVVQFMQYHNYNFWNDPIFKGIYLFHMPLFMLISGYFAAKSTARRGWRVINTYLIRLAMPCVGVMLIGFLIILLKDQSLGNALKTCRPLWFLVVIFECLCFYLILQWKQSLWYRSIMLIIPIIAALLISSVLPIWPYSYHFTYLWPIFTFGVYLSNSGFTHDHINWKWCGFLLPFVFFYFIFQPTWYVYITPLSLNLNTLAIDIIRTLAALSGCGVVMWIIKYLHPYIGKFFIVQKIGQATLALYALHVHLFNFNYSNILSFPIGYIDVFFISTVMLAVLYIFYIITRKSPALALLLYGEWDKRK